MNTQAYVLWKDAPSVKALGQPGPAKLDWDGAFLRRGGELSREDGLKAFSSGGRFALG